MRHAVRRFGELLRSPITVLLTALISISSLAISYQANAVAAQEAKVRASLIEGQNRKLQNAFCGVVEPFGFLSKPSTPSGEDLAESFRNAAKELNCTVDPLDGR
ncbi:hypothetical protein [Kocuria rosea]|uniref:hypothetical protein n=1 Tax=Kocuria rosea TaxID=1275 RepID=UPI0011A920A2|nr:hypothetical protein [Kocuria rosea]